MTAAFELSRPEHGCDVTVYQQGWRLGGKGASGRGPSGRIEEHGLHVWMGYYENAFRLMRECYEELERDQATCPLATWEDAFAPSAEVAAADRLASGDWSPWCVTFPPSPGKPGGPARDYKPPTIGDYLSRTAALVSKLLSTTFRVQGPGTPPPGTNPRDLLRQLLGYGGLGGLGALLEALRTLEHVLAQAGTGLDPGALGGIAAPLGAVTEKSHVLLEEFVRDRDELRRLWGVVDVALASIRGLAKLRMDYPKSDRLDPLDSLDCREWLRQHGASQESINSSFVRALYDLGFAFEDGDFERPGIAAGAAMRGSMRAFFEYHGSFFWKMQAGMGDVVFAPLYEVLARRGVRFRFFHRLRDVRVAGAESGRPHVEALDFDVQARTSTGRDYQPLTLVNGVPCWPAEPDWAQLDDAARLRAAPHDLESHWSDARSGTTTLARGRDFDAVVLAVGVGALPHVAKSLVASDEIWPAMIGSVKTVPTRAFQIWLGPTMEKLGWEHGPVSLTAFRPPFDTWADMTHLASAEGWRAKPGAIAYFCSVHGDPGPVERTDPAREHERVKREAISFLNNDIGRLWPGAQRREGEFRWDALHDEAGGQSARRGQARFDGQFWRANVSPTDRYTLSLPGSIQHRMSPLNVPVHNLTVAGDWTDCRVNLGCVEAAVTSGLLAAHAICQSPPLSSIVGLRHP
jgi:uncharacterized protein with NAD-binding domain and iron-sulfur cluster